MAETFLIIGIAIAFVIGILGILATYNQKL